MWYVRGIWTVCSKGRIIKEVVTIRLLCHLYQVFKINHNIYGSCAVLAR